jgi:hypothetical protein
MNERLLGHAFYAIRRRQCPCRCRPTPKPRAVAAVLNPPKLLDPVPNAYGWPSARYDPAGVADIVAVVDAAPDANASSRVTAALPAVVWIVTEMSADSPRDVSAFSARDVGGFVVAMSVAPGAWAQVGRGGVYCCPVLVQQAGLDEPGERVAFAAVGARFPACPLTAGEAAYEHVRSHARDGLHQRIAAQARRGLVRCWTNTGRRV